MIFFTTFVGFNVEAYELPQDTSNVSMLQQTTKADSINYKTKSSSGAILRSFALPGWGQIYVESYWKAPIFFAGAATLGYLIYKNQSDYNQYDDWMKDYDKTSLEYLQLKKKRENSLDNRDMSAFYLLGVYALAAVDAYVGSHLYDFDVENEYSLFLSNSNNTFYVNFRYVIK